MVDIDVSDTQLTLSVLGLDRLWSLRSRIEIPLEHVRGARTVTSRADFKQLIRSYGFGLRVPGTGLPGVIMAGTYYFSRGGKVFIDVHYPIEHVVVIELAGDAFSSLVVDVADADATADLIRSALHVTQN